MTALSIASQDVHLLNSGPEHYGKAKEDIAAGQVVARDVDGGIILADNTDEAKLEVLGIASNSAFVGQTVRWAATGARLAVGAGNVTLGAVYYLGTGGGLDDDAASVTAGNHFVVPVFADSADSVIVCNLGAGMVLAAAAAP